MLETESAILSREASMRPDADAGMSLYGPTGARKYLNAAERRCFLKAPTGNSSIARTSDRRPVLSSVIRPKAHPSAYRGDCAIIQFNQRKQAGQLDVGYR
jgi:hypothetical protein